MMYAQNSQNKRKDKIPKPRKSINKKSDKNSDYIYHEIIKNKTKYENKK